MTESDDPVQKEYQAVLALLGEALSMWARAEDTICRVFELAANPNEPLYAAEAYHAVVSFEARMAMVDAVVKRRIRRHEVLLKKWTSLINRINKKSKKRNELAHSQVIVFSDSRSRARKKDYIYILPFWATTKMPLKLITEADEPDARKREKHNMASLGGPGSNSLQLSEIRSRLESFQKLNADIWRYYEHLRLWTAQRSESPLPLSHHPTSHG